MKEKIQKILSNHGIGSRRFIEKCIKRKELYINKKEVKIGMKINIKNIKKIFLKNKEVFLKKDSVKIIKYNKPLGEICTHFDPHHKNIIYNNLPVLKNSKWINVGRLDQNTSGLLLITNNGDIAYRLMHPKFKILREYIVEILGDVSMKKINLLKNGIYLDQHWCKFHTMQYCYNINKKQVWKVSLFQGRNREIRKLWNFCGITVIKLIRIKFGCIKLTKYLKVGKFLWLTNIEIKKIYDLVYAKK